MSNTTIIERIKTTWYDFSVGELALTAFIDNYHRDVDAPEGLPYPLIVEAREIAHELQALVWAIKEDCVVDSLPTFRSLTAWIAKVQALRN